MKKHIVLIIVFLSTIMLWSCKSHDKKERVIVFHAGSLSIPFKQMKSEFEKINPNTEILLEAAGSVKCARKITDLKKECDIMASADYTVIDEMLVPEYTNWNIKFASNEMAIAYHKQSKYANEINASNWFEILLKDDVIYGRSDPNSDPCGYRTVLISQLAEDFYSYAQLSDKIINKDQRYIRPKETDLLALLESNTIDYIFLYRSVAEQHNLQFITLPDSINLSNPALQDYYKNATIDILGKEPGTYIQKNGQAMVYGLSVLNNAPNKELALKFVDFVLSKEHGTRIMEANGQASLVPSKTSSYDDIPNLLKKYALK